MSFNKQNRTKQDLFSYWDKLREANDTTIKILIDSKYLYGENQDFVAATIAANMPKLGYIRSETVSVYFREYKRKHKVGQ